MSSKRRYTFNLFLLAIAILWPMLQVIYFSGLDGYGRINIVITLMAIVVNGKHLFQTPKNIHIWLLWIIYCIINAQFKGFSHESSSFAIWAHHHLLYPYVIMLVTYQVVSFDMKKSVQVLFGVYFIYTVVGAINMESIDSYDVGKRMGNELGNAYFNTIILLMSFAAFLYVTNRVKLFVVLTIAACLSYILILSGERKGLIALFIIFIGSYMAVTGGKGFRSIISYVFLAIFAYFAIDLLMENTTFGARMANSIQNTDFKGNRFLTLVGDRAIQYDEGWSFFLQNPLTGIGIRNYAKFNTYWEGGGGVLHTEYMVQLTECGIVGSILFLIFYYGMIKRLFNPVRKKEDSAMIIILRANLIAIIVINLVAWTYDNPNFFMLFGIIYALCEKEKVLQTNNKLVNIHNYENSCSGK